LVPSKGSDRIIACIDGTVSSERVLPLAASWATQLGARVELLAVAESHAPLPSHGERYHPDWHDDPNAYLAELARHPDLEGIETHTDVLLDPTGPAQAIGDYLFWNPAGLVITASHLRTQVDRALHGSTTARIIRACPIPVLVQPAAEAPPM
jgi:nucleotide-binding universal stress UspA family protein